MTQHSFDAILDSGAPRTEFSDAFLKHVGLISEVDECVDFKPGLQSQKYGLFSLPVVEICEHRLCDFDVFVSRFESSWGIDALIGLDFFRRYQVTIDFFRGVIMLESYS